MTKEQELSNPESCFNRARPGERMFVILERDITMPGTIRDWVKRRLVAKKNDYLDDQIKEALELAKSIERDRQ